MASLDSNIHEDKENITEALLTENIFIEDPKMEDQIKGINKFKLTFIAFVINLPGLIYGYTSTDSN